MLIVTDTGDDITRPAYVLRDLPVELLGRIRSDRVLRRPAPSHEEFLRAHPGADARPSTAASSPWPTRPPGLNHR
ncbi:hypothetical protein [Nonomuraea sp. NPDC023979]|uniref:hypothetical protein n=1 Tax=Nonomuraea sp. NPDC023979 TaxID=3154796 RepID=UPI00340A5E9B